MFFTIHDNVFLPKLMAQSTKGSFEEECSPHLEQLPYPPYQLVQGQKIFIRLYPLIQQRQTDRRNRIPSTIPMTPKVLSLLSSISLTASIPSLISALITLMNSAEKQKSKVQGYFFMIMILVSN